MSDLQSHNPTGRFAGLAQLYARHRPSYPDQVIDHLVTCSGLDGTTPVADLGSGTGISARLLAARGIPVIGIEPNEEMRRQAESEGCPEGCPRPVYQAGTGEQTGLPDGSVTLVLSAQAFHWFDADAAFREIHRILRPGGWIALLWNERDERDPFTAAYGAVIRTAPDAHLFEYARASAGLPLLQSSLFEGAERLTFDHAQILDEEGVLGRAFSASYAPREPVAAEAFAAKLREVFARFAQQGKVALRYCTTLYLARRKALSH